jgi:hypothetical protein
MRITLITAIVASIIATGAIAGEGNGQGDTFANYSFGASAVSGGMSASSITNGNGSAEFQSYSGASQTSSAKFSENNTVLTVVTSGFDAAGSQGLIVGEGKGFASSLGVRGGFATGSAGFATGGFQNNAGGNGNGNGFGNR